MKFFTDDISEIASSMGLTVASVTSGKIKTGNQVMRHGKLVDELKDGIEVEFTATPTASQLAIFKQAIKGNKDKDNVLADVQNKDNFKLSNLYGLSKAQLETYIDNNITTLANAKDYLKKLSAVVLYLVKQTKLDD